MARSTERLSTKLQMTLSTGDTGGSTKYMLLDKSVGAKCLAALLGIGHGRLGKGAAGAPDLRFGKREHESKPATWSVDGFLQVAYDAIAETLPDQLLSSPKVL